MIDKERYIRTLELEKKRYEKAHAKRDPTVAQDVIFWYMQGQMISWLDVHINGLKDGLYDVKEV